MHLDIRGSSLLSAGAIALTGVYLMDALGRTFVRASAWRHRPDEPLDVHSPASRLRGYAAAGVVAGAVGTAALASLGPVEHEILGRTPVFEPRRLAERLLRKSHVPAPALEPHTHLIGQTMRWIYGPALGVALSLSRAYLPRGAVAAGALFGAFVAVGEMSCLPAVGATPSLRRWGLAQQALLTAQALTFGVVTARALNRGARAGVARYTHAANTDSQTH